MNKGYLGENIPKLGFGFMRLPMKDKEIDMEQTKEMVDIFMKNGFTYFDTAYVYIGGKSECAIKEAVVDRYDRDSFQIATKLPLWDCKNEEDMEKAFNVSLERSGAGYFDFYLLHAMGTERFTQAEEIKAWDFVLKKKAEGKIKHVGFSFHDSAAVLDDALTKHPETEFVQLQINYIDWESDDVEARKCYEVALKHNKPIIIMEPVKGGNLVNLSPDASKVLKDVQPKLSIPSWAIRYCASLDNIVTVLSGMSNLEQLKDNVSYMKDFTPINSEEKAAIDKVVDIINRTPVIPCTDCKYCVDGCPQNINIPALFSTLNHHKKFDGEGTEPSNRGSFNEAVKEKGKPSDCIACGACEGQCPQHIKIIEELANVAKVYE